MNKKTVAVIFGGKSTEHEGAVESALHVIHNIDRSRYCIHALYVNKEGNISTPVEFKKAVPDFFENKLITIVPSLAMEQAEFINLLNADAVFPENSSEEGINFFDNILRKKYDAVFPIFHGLNGEDGTIQGMLKFMDMPCVGCGLNGSVLGIDKEITKTICSRNNIRVTEFYSIRNYEWKSGAKEKIKKIEEVIKYPMFVKPARLGSSIGISRVTNREELISGINTAFSYDSKVLVEEGLIKPREFAVGVMGYDDKTAVSAVGEFQSYKEDFFDYEAKYGTMSLNGIIPAVIEKEIEEQLRKTAFEAFKHLEINGFARVDCFYDGSNIYLNEVNTIPGLETHGTFTKTWAALGISRKEFLTTVIENAIEEHRNKEVKTNI